MTKNYLKQLLLTIVLLASASNVLAIDFPKIGEYPVDGNEYILVSYVKPDIFFTRTSWDGAYYLLPYDQSNCESHAFTAHKGVDGNWCFSITESNGNEKYIGIPAGTDNLNGNLDDPAYFILEEGDVSGFYRIKAGEGNPNYNVTDRYLHLNGGGQFLIISEPTNSYYPDFWGGVQTEMGDDGETYRLTDENGEFIPNDHSSENWAFVSRSDIPALKNRILLYASIKDIEDNYLTNETFAKGFQGAIDAVLPVYNSETLTEEDAEAAMAIINAKFSLYREILSAEELLLEGEDDALKAAIETATSVFNNANDAAQLMAALQALADAETIHTIGQGDLTRLGQNMSFEDLSSQDGNTTSGVAAPPSGWTLLVNGKQVTSISEENAAGLNAWAGINGDGTGAKEGNYIYGIWNSGMPEIELSQTLTGLENGTYTVFAAVMVGANGNGSRRTTQRIFGNLNTKYFGSSYEYDLSRLDKSDVYDFEGLSEPVTDTELQEMSVQAFVYDGTLKFGFRTNNDIKAANRTTSNGAGGDGWFKIDNFRIIKEEYNPDDALRIYDHFVDVLSELLDQYMQQSVYDDAIALLETTKVTTANSQDEIINAFLKLRDICPRIESSVNAYKKLEEALRIASVNLYEYTHYAGADEYGDIVLEAENMYYDHIANEAEIEEMIQKLNDGFDALKLSGVAVGIYVTDLLKNPGFEDLSAQGDSETGGVVNPPYGWNLYLNGNLVTSQSEITAAGVQNWCGINNGDPIEVVDEEGNVITHQYVEGTHLWGIWTEYMPDVELSQTLSGMPAGTYVLTANVMVQNNWAGDNITTQRIFGNDYIQMFGSEDAHAINLPEDAKAAKAFDESGDYDLKKLTYAGYTCESGDRNTDLLHPMIVRFGVGEDGVAYIGFRTNKVGKDGTERPVSGAGWFKLDNFQLFYESEDIPTNVKGVTGNVTASKIEYYSADGRQLNSLQPGLNIIKTIMSDGSVKTIKYVLK